MTQTKSKLIAKLPLPFAKELQLFDINLENGGNLFRVRIREGSRFTILDLDPETAKIWGSLMTDWASDPSNVKN